MILPITFCVELKILFLDKRPERDRTSGTTQYLYGSLSAPFQVTASRSPDNVLTTYYYDEFGALYPGFDSGR